MNEVKRAAIYSPEVDPYGIGLAYTFIIDHDLYLANVYMGEESMKELANDAAKKYFDVIIVKNADVIAKDTEELLAFGHAMPIPFIGAEDLYCTNEYLDLETMKYVPLDTFIWGSEAEDKTSDAVAAVIQRRKENRFWIGHTPFGFLKIGRRFIPDPATAPFVEQIFIKASEGERYTDIATWLDQEGVPVPTADKASEEDAVGTQRWSDNTIRDILKNDKYTRGIISRELFDEVQARFNEHQQKLKAKPKAEEKPRGLYQGMVKCESCGRNMVYKPVGTDRRKNAIYQCKFHTGKNPRAEALEHNPVITEEKLKEEVLQQCNDYIDFVAENKKHIALAERHKKKMEVLEQQITGIGEKIIRNENVNDVEGLWNSWMSARNKYLTVSGYLGLVQFQFKILHIEHMDETDPDVERKLIQSISVGPDGTVKVHFKGDWIFT